MMKGGNYIEKVYNIDNGICHAFPIGDSFL